MGDNGLGGLQHLIAQLSALCQHFLGFGGVVHILSGLHSCLKVFIHYLQPLVEEIIVWLREIVRLGVLVEQLVELVWFNDIQSISQLQWLQWQVLSVIVHKCFQLVAIVITAFGFVFEFNVDVQRQVELLIVMSYVGVAPQDQELQFLFTPLQFLVQFNYSAHSLFQQFFMFQSTLITQQYSIVQGYTC